MIRQTKGEKIFNIINTVILCALVVIMVYPCLHVLFASLSDSSELMKNGGFLIYPKGFTLNAYLEVFKNQLIWSGYGNTILNLVLALAFNISLTTFWLLPVNIRKTVSLVATNRRCEAWAWRPT